MEFIFIILSWMILLVPGFDDSVPPTDGKIFKIETSPDIVQSIKIQSDKSLDLWGFDIVLKQNSTGTLEIKIPKNLPTPASFIDFWAYDERAYALANGTEINYDVVEDPCYSHYKIPIEGKTNVEIVYSVIAAGTWQLYSPIEFDKDNPCYNEVFYEKLRESPLKQFKSGISIDKIQCRDNLQLILKTSNNSPACVKPETKTKLIERGWATVDQLENKIITPEDNDKLINIKKGESFVVKLDSGYDWRIGINNKTVIDSDYSDIRYSGSQGVYRAHNSGQAILTGIGDPVCRLSEPPCMSPSILFQLNINVK